jgi:hypothetical protein
MFGCRAVLVPTAQARSALDPPSAGFGLPAKPAIAARFGGQAAGCGVGQPADSHPDRCLPDECDPEQRPARRGCPHPLSRRSRRHLHAPYTRRGTVAHCTTAWQTSGQATRLASVPWLGETQSSCSRRPRRMRPSPGFGRCEPAGLALAGCRGRSGGSCHPGRVAG